MTQSPICTIYLKAPLEGSGQFEIDGETYQVSAGVVVEIPPKHSFDYNWQMSAKLGDGECKVRGRFSSKQDFCDK